MGQRTVAVTGGTGFVGSKLVETLVKGGDQVRVLTRDAYAAKEKFIDPRISVAGPNDWGRAIKGCDAVVNLAGEPISTRWTPELKASIRSSRLNATRNVVDAINGLTEDERPDVLVSASALGYYGASLTNEFTEDSPSGDDFLAKLCQEWEELANQAETRVVTIRVGIVLGAGGGALGKMIPIFKLFAGGPVGSGRQWFSWIHREDLVSLIIEAIDNKEVSGAINATAPNPVTMGEMCTALGRTIGRPSWLPVPEFALKTLLGEGAGVVLEGQRVLPKRAQDMGFNFKFTSIDAALQDICQ